MCVILLISRTKLHERALSIESSKTVKFHLKLNHSPQNNPDDTRYEVLILVLLKLSLPVCDAV